MTSDDLKEVGNIALEGQKLPQKAERLRNVLLAAIRSGTNPNQFDTILPDLYRFLTQDCYVDKWKPHKISDILSSGDNIVGDFIAEQYSKQNKAFAAPTAGISDEIWKPEENRFENGKADEHAEGCENWFMWVRGTQ